MPSSARTRTWASADTETTRPLGFGRLDEDEVVWGVEIDRQRPVELDQGRARARGGGEVGLSAAATEREVDDVGRSQPESVGAGPVAVGDDDDERAVERRVRR